MATATVDTGAELKRLQRRQQDLLREQVDLGTLSGDLRTAVDETMQPAHVSVWLRGPA